MSCEVKKCIEYLTKALFDSELLTEDYWDGFGLHARRETAGEISSRITDALQILEGLECEESK